MFVWKTNMILLCTESIRLHFLFKTSVLFLYSVGTYCTVNLLYRKYKSSVQEKSGIEFCCLLPLDIYLTVNCLLLCLGHCTKNTKHCTREIWNRQKSRSLCELNYESLRSSWMSPTSSSQGSKLAWRWDELLFVLTWQFNTPVTQTFY